MEILETKGRKMNKIKREERENLHTFSDTTQCKENEKQLQTAFIYCANNRQSLTSSGALAYLFIKSVTHYM